ncbi:GGDEF domain-containing protein [Saccharospirillum salsuginis]|uniref:GGDEF domain-containing protein n=1 Tax=Saccharospirillum salsuginis TaxID=418750 RepID=A0A918KTM8_9GAMM|nr:GGDEF domain-containing protein [Saccharospirillum salsuginis]GGX73394.1 hypothetical protein GCM10007392_46030 [Saccharospirillum salsuginis]
MTVKFWPTAVPGDSELRSLSLRMSLWVGLIAYGIYILALEFTAESGFLVPFLLLCAGLHGLALISYYLDKPLFAATWMVLVFLFCFTIMNLFGFTRMQSAEYYFLLIPALIFMVLPPERREWQNTLLTLTLALLTLVFIVPEPAEPWFVMSEDAYRRFKWLDLVVCFIGMAVVCRYFIYRLMHQRNQLERLALTDALTGLPNRHGLMRQLATWYNQGQPFAVYLLDVDEMRAINRRHGHEIGDTLMRKLAQRLRADIDELALIARVGADQFVIAVEAMTDEDVTLSLARRIQSSASRMAFDLGGRAERIEVSIGTTLSLDREEPQALLARLGQALRQARDKADRVHLMPAQADVAEGVSAEPSSAPLATRP